MNGKIIKQMDMGNIYIQMEQNMKECGETIYNMVLVLKLGLMVVNMKVIMLMEKKKEKGL